MSRHTRENVHPECAILDGAVECTCEEAAGYVPDTDAGQLRAIEVAERMEARRNPVTPKGIGPDSDAAIGDDTRPRFNDGADRGAGQSALVASAGCWKESENERCKLGLDFSRGELPLTHATTGNWARAQEQES